MALIIAILLSTVSVAQQFSALRHKTLTITSDSTRIDSLTIIPSSLQLRFDKKLKGSFTIDTLNSIFIVTDHKTFFQSSDSIRIIFQYRVFPDRLNKRWEPIYNRENPDQDILMNRVMSKRNRDTQQDFFDFGELQKSGAISRGFSLGNNQDASLNSDLNLQLNGALTNDINIRAAITDNNIPVQPEGNTQQIQDFDKVFIEISQGNNRLLAGDFEITQTQNEFLKYRQKVQGVMAETQINTGDKKENKLNISAGAALSTGKYARNNIDGIEGNQGPYKLRGNNNERFIIVLSATESVYLDGRKLERGESNDYVINYNTAEISFTPKNMITKDSRIVVEFEYSDRNYARALFATDLSYKTSKLEVRLNYFNQSDLKNQPFEMELNDTSRRVLANAGDDPQKAIISGVDSIPFSSDEILYKMIDSLGFDSVLVYSTNPDSAHYRVRFSKVGQGNGDYVKTQSAANGTVYLWVQPVGGISQGEYAPVQLLIPPRKTEVVSLSASLKLSRSIKTGFNATTSIHDKNLFSDLDAGDDQGFAGQYWIKHSEKIGKNKDSTSLKWNTEGSIRFINRNFEPVNRFRPVEFDRDWNLSQNQNSDEILTNISTGLKHQKNGYFKIQHQYLQRKNRFDGQRYSLSGNLEKNGYFATVNGSLLESDRQGLASRFFRHKAEIGKRFRYFRFSLHEDREHNTFRTNKDSVNSQSYAYQLFGARIALPDSSRFFSTLEVEQRSDQLPLNGKLTETSIARQAALLLRWQPGKHQRIEARFGYRKLEIRDSISPAKPEENLNSRINYSGSFADGAITNQTFFQSGSGLEVKKEFTYLEVSPGQGLYQWEDYNNNGVKELDEFEIASFQDQANYIRVYTPSDEYIRVYQNRFTQVLYLNPSRVWRKSEKGMQKFLAKFTNRFSYRVSQKNQLDDFLRAYNPFYRAENENKIITLNEQLRNTFYFQRSHSSFGANWTYRKTASKSLLANGNEQQSIEENNIDLRWNISSSLSLVSELSKGTKRRESEFFSSKEFNIDYHAIKPVLSYQPGTKFRLRGIFNYENKQNRLSAAEKARIFKYGLEFRRSTLNKGNMQLNFNYLDIRYPGAENSNLEYEMLQGFKDGNNFQWTLTWQRKLLAYLQLNLQYEGRKTPDAKTVHIGRIQVRAFF